MDKQRGPSSLLIRLVLSKYENGLCLIVFTLLPFKYPPVKFTLCASLHTWKLSDIETAIDLSLAKLISITIDQPLGLYEIGLGSNVKLLQSFRPPDNKKNDFTNRDPLVQHIQRSINLCLK